MSVLPDTFINQFEKGSRALERGDVDSARAHWKIAANENPVLWGCLANKTLREGDLRLALELYLDAYEASKDPTVRALCLNDIGMIFSRLGDRARAEQCFRDAAALSDRHAEIHLNLAICEGWHGNYDAKLKHLDKCIRLRPDLHEAYMARAFTLLLRGQYSQAWNDYESRWKNGRMQKPNIGGAELLHPRQALRKTVLVYAEQGAGDTIMMARYFRRLRLMGCKLIIAPQKNLIPLIRWMDCADQVIEFKDDSSLLPKFDFSIPAMSLPKLFACTPDSIPACGYVEATSPMQLRGDMKIGIAWGGSPGHVDDKLRSIPLREFWPFFAVPGITWYSLQVGCQSIELMMENAPITDIAANLKDYSDTANAIAGLDLIIAVDTSVVHLAGAMNKPVWMLTPFNPDWRWMLDTERSPWYPSIRLFRQKQPGDWSPPIAAIHSELYGLCNRKLAA